MSNRHFDRGVLRRFLRLELTAAENREVVRHLLSGCASCKEAASKLWGHLWESEPETPPRPFQGALARARERQALLDRETGRAPELYEQLRALPPGRQLVLVRNSLCYRSWGLCQWLFERSWESRFDDVERTHELARLAVLVAEELDAEAYGAQLVADLRARAWSHLANAHTICSDYRKAERAYEKAEVLLEEGTGDPLERARLLQWKANLRNAQDRFPDALRLHDRALALYRRAGDRHAVGVALSDKGMAAGYLGEIEVAIDLLNRALGFIDCDVDPRAYLAARHNLILFLNDAGELEKAMTLLEETRHLYDQLQDRLNFLRLRWLEGKMAAALGERARAEEALLDVRDGFLDQDIGYDAAEVSLELAYLYAQEGRRAEVQDLALNLIPVFTSRDVPQGVIAALMTFLHAVDQETLSLELVRRLLDYLDKARDNPDLKFPLPS